MDTNITYEKPLLNRQVTIYLMPTALAWGIEMPAKMHSGGRPTYCLWSRIYQAKCRLRNHQQCNNPETSL